MPLSLSQTHSRESRVLSYFVTSLFNISKYTTFKLTPPVLHLLYVVCCLEQFEKLTPDCGTKWDAE